MASKRKLQSNQDDKPLVHTTRMSEQQIIDKFFPPLGEEQPEPPWCPLSEARLLQLMLSYRPIGINKHINLDLITMYMKHIYAKEDGVNLFISDQDLELYATQLTLPPSKRLGRFEPAYVIRPTTEQIRDKIKTFFDLNLSEYKEMGDLPPELVERSDFSLPSTYFTEDLELDSDEERNVQSVNGLSHRSHGKGSGPSYSSTPKKDASSSRSGSRNKHRQLPSKKNKCRSGRDVVLRSSSKEHTKHHSRKNSCISSEKGDHKCSRNLSKDGRSRLGKRKHIKTEDDCTIAPPEISQSILESSPHFEDIKEPASGKNILYSRSSSTEISEQMQQERYSLRSACARNFPPQLDAQLGSDIISKSPCRKPTTHGSTPQFSSLEMLASAPHAQKSTTHDSTLPICQDASAGTSASVSQEGLADDNGPQSGCLELPSVQDKSQITTSPQPHIGNNTEQSPPGIGCNSNIGSQKSSYDESSRVVSPQPPVAVGSPQSAAQEVPADDSTLQFESQKETFSGGSPQPSAGDGTEPFQKPLVGVQIPESDSQNPLTDHSSPQSVSTRPFTRSRAMQSSPLKQPGGDGIPPTDPQKSSSHENAPQSASRRPSGCDGSPEFSSQETVFGNSTPQRTFRKPSPRGCTLQSSQRPTARCSTPKLCSQKLLDGDKTPKSVSKTPVRDTSPQYASQKSSARGSTPRSAPQRFSNRTSSESAPQEALAGNTVGQASSPKLSRRRSSGEQTVHSNLRDTTSTEGKLEGKRTRKDKKKT